MCAFVCIQVEAHSSATLFSATKADLSKAWNYSPLRITCRPISISYPGTPLRITAGGDDQWGDARMYAASAPKSSPVSPKSVTVLPQALSSDSDDGMDTDNFALL